MKNWFMKMESISIGKLDRGVGPKDKFGEQRKSLYVIKVRFPNDI
jgi:hypothetical protein